MSHLQKSCIYKGLFISVYLLGKLLTNTLNESIAFHCQTEVKNSVLCLVSICHYFMKKRYEVQQTILSHPAQFSKKNVYVKCICYLTWQPIGDTCYTMLHTSQASIKLNIMSSPIAFYEVSPKQIPFQPTDHKQVKWICNSGIHHLSHIHLTNIS